MNRETLLQATNLCCVRNEKALFAHISFSLKYGETLLVEGPNGSGKSSLLRLLTGLATPVSGEVIWRGQSIRNQTAYFENLHYIGHANGIKLGLTVAENLRLASYLAQSEMNHDIYSAKAESIFESLQLSAYKNKPAMYLSAGQKRRLALARLFLVPKILWILDEPLTALDAETQQFFLSQLAIHLQSGGISIVSSHHPICFKGIATNTLRLNTC